MTTDKKLNKAKRMIAKANGKPFVFDATITFKGEESSKHVECCFCPNLELYNKLSDNNTFDEKIFFFFFNENDFVTVLSEQGDFILNDFDENSCVEVNC